MIRQSEIHSKRRRLRTDTRSGAKVYSEAENISHLANRFGAPKQVGFNTLGTVDDNVSVFANIIFDDNAGASNDQGPRCPFTSEATRATPRCTAITCISSTTPWYPAAMPTLSTPRPRRSARGERRMPMIQNQSESV